MNLDTYNIYPKWRLGQREAIQEILDTYEKIRTGEIESKVIESALPTGSGKTIVNRAVALALLDLYPGDFKNIIYTTPLKNLVAQIAEETALDIPTVTGKSNYPCITMPALNASECPYRTAALIKERPETCKDCEYAIAKKEFRDADLKACTFDFILFNPSPADMYIFDESTGVETKLLNHFELTLPPRIDINRLIPTLRDWFDDLYDEKVDYNNQLEAIMWAKKRERNPSQLAARMKDIQMVTKKLNSVDQKLGKVGRIMEYASDPNDYYIDELTRKFKLIYGKPLFKRFISKPKVVIMSSGTPNTILLSDKFTRVESPHPIPVSRRKVFYQPVGKMSQKNQDKTIPAMAAKIMEIHKGYPRQTIVHCHSFGLGLKLKTALNSPLVLLQEEKKREEWLEQFLAAKECIGLCMAFDEGLNLPGAQFQRNIIPKVPYPGLSGWVKKRNDSDEKKYMIDQWYRISTAVTIQQASGRTTRGPDDYSETYILDLNFSYFYSQNKIYFEKWFKDALVWRK
jgi:Rad3-related DNA helicase